MQYMLQTLLKGMTTSAPPSDPSASATEAISQLSLSLEDCSRGRRIAVLGGSFDPITTGHLKVACEIIHTRKADEAWIVPCGARPDKPFSSRGQEASHAPNRGVHHERHRVQ